MHKEFTQMIVTCFVFLRWLQFVLSRVLLAEQWIGKYVYLHFSSNCPTALTGHGCSHAFIWLYAKNKAQFSCFGSTVFFILINPCHLATKKSPLMQGRAVCFVYPTLCFRLCGLCTTWTPAAITRVSCFLERRDMFARLKNICNQATSKAHPTIALCC